MSAPVGPLKRSHFIEQGIISPLYTVLRFSVGCLDFYEDYFESTSWHHYMKNIANYGARFGRMNITNDDLLNLPIPYPSIPEQQKIANFLTSTDELIDKCNNQITEA